ncbi:MAG: hypothetical protein ACTXOO_05350 [Sodalis sp. (in: enterobacteria)]
MEKLSYNLQQEIESFPEQIERLEQEIGQLQAQMALPDFFSQPQETTHLVLTAISCAEDALEEAFTRWEILETQKNGKAE